MSLSANDLYKKYPRFFKNCHISVGDGWLSEIDKLCQRIEDVYQQLSDADKALADERGMYVGCQIKEKFGELRFYMDGETPEMSKWIAETETACNAICEYCGAEGKMRHSSWWKTLCDSCSFRRDITRLYSYKDIDLQALKDNHVRLYYFGLGFIQLKIDETYRLHFYSPELPPITEDIHNHRYDFRSRILKGSITNYHYSIANGSDYLIDNESCNPDIQAPSEKRFCNAALAGKNTYTSGKSYRLTHDEFHRVEADNCITLLARGEYKKEFAQVVIPTNKQSVCPFSKKIPEERLWQIIEKMLNE